mgnify:CR=1 FL=1
MSLRLTNTCGICKHKFIDAEVIGVGDNEFWGGINVVCEDCYGEGYGEFVELCYDCDTPMSKTVLNEKELDEHEDRMGGYGKDGEWRCGDCRSNEEEEDEIYCHNETPCGYNSYIYEGCDEWGTREENDNWICKKCRGEDIEHLTDKEYISHLEKKGATSGILIRICVKNVVNVLTQVLLIGVASVKKTISVKNVVRRW